MFAICFFFFFSSRRRHTRLQGDWSSDVCSSDLDDKLFEPRVKHAENLTLRPEDILDPPKVLDASVEVDNRNLLERPDALCDRTPDKTLLIAIRSRNAPA